VFSSNAAPLPPNPRRRASDDIMCGITGYLSDDPRARAALPAMTAALAHRGPDADGFHCDGPVGLGHRRLAVIDLAGSRQPLLSADGTVAVVFNGEIYNFRELRRELASAGHVFVTNGDGEVLVHGWKAWGERMLERLTGMFAFALWDRARRALFLARDPVGVKPLYYAWHAGSFVFGSELKALRPFPGLPHDLDLDALALYLECQYIPAPRSIYAAIRKLPAGHWLAVRDGNIATGAYWRPSYVPKSRQDGAVAVDALEHELRRSVESMLVSDVPLGAFVSGGVDSGVIAALATRISGRAIDTFNLGFTGRDVGSEHEHAARVARHIGSRHHCLMLAPGDVLPALDRWVDVFDEPFGDQAALPTMLLAQYARREVTVVLTGEGADEVFGGYSNYTKRVREERITRVLGARGSPLPSLARRLPPRLARDRILKAVAEPRARRYATIPNIFDDLLRGEYFTPAFHGAVRARIADSAEVFYDECDSPAYLDHLLNIDARLWLPDDLLAKVDRATMAFSLEARVPYLDHGFFGFCARLPPAQKISGNLRKVILKRLAERHLPHEIVQREKQGFMMPLDRWLANELKADLARTLGPTGLQRRGLIRPEAIARLQAEHAAGRKNHAMRLWVLLILERWFARYEPDFAL
jgi:asparagine synthase (glutamine-hydrolysing)